MATYIRGTGDSDSKCCGCGGRDFPCSPFPESNLECRTASASLTKCGFYEWTGYVSNPPKVYRTSTLSGTLTTKTMSSFCIDCNSQIIYAYSGNQTISRIACSGVDYRQVQITQYLYDCIGLSSSSTVYAVDVGGVGYNDSYTSTVHTATGSGCQTSSAGAFEYTGTATNTLSDEYTTAELYSDVVSQIPSFSGSFSGPASCTGAYYDTTSDELTITMRKMEYRFVLPTLTGYSCYKISWNETFTPEGGGSATVTPKSYVWNGSDTVTPTYTIDVPQNQGTTTVTDISFSCVCS